MSTHHDGTAPVTEGAEPATRYLRLQVELVMEITDPGVLASAALEQLQDENLLPDSERARAREAVRRDESEALALLIDPFDLVNDLPGVELVQASWNSAHTEYDPDDEEWDFYEGEDEGADEEGDAGDEE